MAANNNRSLIKFTVIETISFVRYFGDRKGHGRIIAKLFGDGCMNAWKWVCIVLGFAN